MSEKTTMSITRALSTLKSLKEQIDTYFHVQRKFIGIQFGQEGNVTSFTNFDTKNLKSQIQSDYDKLAHYIEQHTKIKQAINLSNSVTMVKIKNKEMSVSDAIVMKANISIKENLLKKMREYVTMGEKEMEKQTKEFDTRLAAITNASIPVGASAEEISEISKRVREEQMKIVGPVLVDPLNLASKIKELDEEINLTKNELDYILSESNTMTTITV